MSTGGGSPGQRPAQPGLKPASRGLLFNLGAFFGHVVQAVKADVRAERTVLRHETTQEQRDTPLGPVTLRRTVIEEVRLDGARQQGPRAGDGA